MPAPPALSSPHGPPQRPAKLSRRFPPLTRHLFTRQFYKRGTQLWTARRQISSSRDSLSTSRQSLVSENLHYHQPYTCSDGDRPPVAMLHEGERQRQAVEAVDGENRSRHVREGGAAFAGQLVRQPGVASCNVDDGGRGQIKVEVRREVSSTIKNIDGERLREYTETDGWPLREEMVREIVDEVGDACDMYFFTSWTRFGFYEADFGFGRPIWMGIGGPVMKNMITLTARGGVDGGGMEAWVTLEEEDMIRFERDEEILAYTSSSV